MMELSMLGLLLSLYLMIKVFHPMILSLVLVFYAFVSALMLHFTFSKWLFFVIMMMFLGGMMIMFIYIASLSGNDKMEKLKISVSYWGILIFTFFAFNNSLISKKSFFVTHIYSDVSASLLWFMILYLLLSLFLVIKFSESFKGPLIKLS